MNELFFLMLTIGAFVFSRWINKICNYNPIVSPPIISAAVIICLMLLFDWSYQDYSHANTPIRILLGTVTVGFALPLYKNFGILKRVWQPLLMALVIGCLVGSGSAVGMAWAFGFDKQVLLSVAPKSVTTPIAVGISEQIGGDPAMSISFVMVTGILGIIMASAVFKVLKIKNEVAQGFALGLSSHGLGTFRAFQISERAGAFSSLGMALNGVLTAFLIPLLLLIFF